MSNTRLLVFVAAYIGTAASVSNKCRGKIQLGGLGDQEVEIQGATVNAGQDLAADVHVINGEIRPDLTGRAYFADRCTDGEYNNENYMALQLLGKTLRYTVNLSDAGCGCNAAFYLTNMKQNKQRSTCGDYYCDANSVCGVPCAEIDIQEANMYAWHTTVHSANDRWGYGKGYGGGEPGQPGGARDWSKQQYGPSASCIDTRRPFQVAVSFQTGPLGLWPMGGETLTGIQLQLSQSRSSCDSSNPLSVSFDGYAGNVSVNGATSNKGMSELYSALKEGMTPIVSYWSSDSMLWMDGPGQDWQGPCPADHASDCPTRDNIRFYDFTIEPIGQTPGGGGPWWFWLFWLVCGCAAAAAFALGLKLRLWTYCPEPLRTKAKDMFKGSPLSRMMMEQHGEDNKRLIPERSSSRALPTTPAGGSLTGPDSKGNKIVSPTSRNSSSPGKRERNSMCTCT